MVRINTYAFNECSTVIVVNPTQHYSSAVNEEKIIYYLALL
nr:MAG TPA: hypothetical protein [Caudoviricetes sp.]